MNDYPTKKELKRIREWNFTNPANEFDAFMEHVQSIWHWGEDYFFETANSTWEAHTGGWSGNEDIIYAMKKNAMFWVLYWEESKRGGHYKFSPTGGHEK